jgi:hypothetical protein
MATKFAIASGVWSSGSTWNDGTIPLSGDTVYANGFTVTIDQNITVASLNNILPNYYLQNQVIPLMTSNVSPNGLADASTNTNNAYLAFNGNVNDYWNSGISNTGIISYKFPIAKTIKRYSFYKTNYYSPRAFTFEASNDGTNWTVLQTVTNDTGVVRYTSGDIGNTTSYLYYRLNVTGGNGYEIRIYSFEMSEEATTNVFGTSASGKFDVNTSRNIVFNGGDGIVVQNGAVNSNIVLTINANSPDIVNLSTINGGYILGPNQISSANQDTTALRTYGTCVLNYIGDVYPPSFGYSRSGNFYVGGNNTVNIIGNIYGPTFADGNTSFILNLAASTPTVNITGNIYGPTGHVNNRTIQMSSANGILNITGNIVAQLGSTIVLSAGILNHTGTVQVLNGNARPAVLSTSTNICKFTSPFINYDGTMAVNAYKMNYYSGSTVQWLVQDTRNVNFSLYSANVSGSTLGLPLTSNVRNGVNFGTDGELTGTLIVPSASNVRVGVPFDNTVGTAELTADDFLNAISGSSHPIAARLRNVATVDTVGGQFSAFIS